MEVSGQDPDLNGDSVVLSQSAHLANTARIEQRTPKATAASNSLQAAINLDDFEFVSLVGKGNSAEVKLAEYRSSKKLYAIKTLSKTHLVENSETKVAIVEQRILNISTEENHPFIVNLYGAFQTQTDLCLVMEYIPGGDLMWHLQKGPFAPERTQFHAAAICLVLKFLHERGILYRDLKLDNIMLQPDGHIKVIDFGLCKEDMWPHNTTNTFCGNGEFIAPEILRDKKYGYPIDWWAFGVLVYQMAFQQSPFRGEDMDEIYDEILDEQPSYPKDSPPSTLDLCQSLLKKEPEQRLGSGPEDAQEVMKHHYFAGVNWDDLYHKRVAVPYKPAVSGENDISNFNPELTRRDPTLAPAQTDLSQAIEEEFVGFSTYFRDF